MRFRWLLAAALACLPAVPGAVAAEGGVILLYHRVSDSGPASTRVSPERFAAHLDLIRDRGYEVIPLAELLDGVYGDGVLPERALAVTFDDAWRSVGDTAYPLLRERGMPFTVFVATDAIDAGVDAFLSWQDLRAMTRDGLATVGPHSLSHVHLESLGRDHLGDPVPGEENAEREREIDASLARLRSELGDAVLDVFAYPYGEYSRATEAMLAARGLYGLAQQSGAVGPVTPATRIPRFPFYMGGDSDSRFLTALAAQPLSAVGEEDAQVFFPAQSRAPGQWRFRPVDGDYRRAALRCYAATGEELGQRWVGDDLVVSLPAMRPGRNKINCTAPALSGESYYWYSRLWLLADADGRWLGN